MQVTRLSISIDAVGCMCARAHPRVHGCVSTRAHMNSLPVGVEASMNQSSRWPVIQITVLSAWVVVQVGCCCMGAMWGRPAESSRPLDCRAPGKCWLLNRPHPHAFPLGSCATQHLVPGGGPDRT